MWGNHITRYFIDQRGSTILRSYSRDLASLDRFTFGTAYGQIITIDKDCVRAALDAVRQVRRSNGAVARRLEELEQNLVTREGILQVIQANVAPPSPISAHDPNRLLNTENIGHAR
ncbi:hypothetical protein GN958_ATG10601 [Phytophthora infestans]|uniref:Uncharacterized protein n=1 Tax=Phytophthora infestans TaxID=4787 RepID=A0A8S9UI94_PHYIN|nr:hypothetical protein GN958_ATG10601 [Phytophthora infestans]